MKRIICKLVEDNLSFYNINEIDNLFNKTNILYKQINILLINKIINIEQVIFIDEKIKLFEKYIIKYFKNKK